MKSRCNCHSHNGFLLRPSEEGLAQQTSLEGLTDFERSVKVDIPSSVSASMGPSLHWDDELIDQQYRRFNHGS